MDARSSKFTAGMDMRLCMYTACRLAVASICQCLAARCKSRTLRPCVHSASEIVLLICACACILLVSAGPTLPRTKRRMNDLSRKQAGTETSILQTGSLLLYPPTSLIFLPLPLPSPLPSLPSLPSLPASLPAFL